MKEIQLTNSKKVFDYCEPYIIAEIGANHNGDMELAKLMIKSAVDCGADAVKFQSWTPDSLISKEEYDRNTKYNDSPKKHFGSLKEMVEKYYLRSDQHFELKKYCDELGVDFSSSPFSNTEVDLLDEVGVFFHKVASMDLVNIPLLKYIASKRKPILLSTGMGSLSEIEKAVQTIEKEGNNQIVLLHCVSIYPPEYEDINLNNILMLRNTFGYPVGFSDHTIGTSIPLASVALGACVIEKHFTTDKDLPGWDHLISADPAELQEISIESKNIFKALGSFRRVVSEAEEEKKVKFRRSIVVTKDLKRDHILTAEDLTSKRPGTGISPDYMDMVIGKELISDIQQDSLLKWSNIK